MGATGNSYSGGAPEKKRDLKIGLPDSGADSFVGLGMLPDAPTEDGLTVSWIGSPRVDAAQLDVQGGDGRIL